MVDQIMLHPVAERLLDILNGRFGVEKSRWDISNPPRIVARWRFQDHGYVISLSAQTPNGADVQVSFYPITGAANVDLSDVWQAVKLAVEGMLYALQEYPTVSLEVLCQGAIPVRCDTDPSRMADHVKQRLQTWILSG